jgi:hypothetical protein
VPISFRGQCPDCGRVWDGALWSWDCGRIDSGETATYRSYFCARCVVQLCVPLRLRRNAWLRWVADHAGTIARSRLLFLACERVACVLSEAQRRYAPVQVDIGTMVCPGCGDAMVIGNIDATPLICPGCKGRSARSIRGHRCRAIVVDHAPHGREEVCRVILHLTALTELSKSRCPDGPPAPTSEGPDALWDRELDG